MGAENFHKTPDGKRFRAPKYNRNQRPTKTLRGWNAFEEIERFKASGLGELPLITLFGLIILTAAIFMPYNPNADSWIIGDPFGRSISRWIAVGIALFLFLKTVVWQTEIIITKSGFYHCLFARKYFVSWSDCGPLVVADSTIENTGLFAEHQYLQCVRFRHRRYGWFEDLRLAGVNAHVLAEALNKQRSRFLQENGD